MVNNVLQPLARNVHEVVRLLGEEASHKNVQAAQNVTPTLVYKVEQAENALMMVAKQAHIKLFPDEKRHPGRTFRFSVKVRSLQHP